MAISNQLKESLLGSALAAIDKLRSEGAIVHCITNTVAQNFTANVLLACGGTPSMTVAPEEVDSFSGRADAVLINLGTLDEARRQAIKRSVHVCTSKQKPFVLDPVMCHISASRLEIAKDIVASGPAIIRANTLEANALDMTQNLKSNTVFALTGVVDKVHFDQLALNVDNGSELLSKVTAVGCAQGGLMAALLPKSETPLVAAIASLIWVGIAGENAAAISRGPGSFQANFIDQLYNLSEEELLTKARLS